MDKYNALADCIEVVEVENRVYFRLIVEKALKHYNADWKNYITNIMNLPEKWQKLYCDISDMLDDDLSEFGYNFTDTGHIHDKQDGLIIYDVFVKA